MWQARDVYNSFEGWYDSDDLIYAKEYLKTGKTFINFSTHQVICNEKDPLFNLDVLMELIGDLENGDGNLDAYIPSLAVLSKGHFVLKYETQI